MAQCPANLGEPPSVAAILAPTRRQVNAEDYYGKFRRRRRDWKRGSERSGSRKSENQTAQKDLFLGRTQIGLEQLE